MLTAVGSASSLGAATWVSATTGSSRAAAFAAPSFPGTAGDPTQRRGERRRQRSANVSVLSAWSTRERQPFEPDAASRRGADGDRATVATPASREGNTAVAVLRRVEAAVRSIWLEAYTTRDLSSAAVSISEFVAAVLAAKNARVTAGTLSAALLVALHARAELVDRPDGRGDPLDTLELCHVWCRGREVVVYRWDVDHVSRWIDIVFEAAAAVAVTAADSLLHTAAGAGDQTEMAAATAAANALLTARAAHYDVESVEGLVALAKDGLRDGLSPPTVALESLVRRADFGDPLLGQATPPGDLISLPPIALEDIDVESLPSFDTEEEEAEAERSVKRKLHERRRAQLDAYVACEALLMASGRKHVL